MKVSTLLEATKDGVIRTISSELRAIVAPLDLRILFNLASPSGASLKFRIELRPRATVHMTDDELHLALEVAIHKIGNYLKRYIDTGLLIMTPLRGVNVKDAAEIKQHLNSVRVDKCVLAFTITPGDINEVNVRFTTHADFTFVGDARFHIKSDVGAILTQDQQAVFRSMEKKRRDDRTPHELLLWLAEIDPDAFRKLPADWKKLRNVHTSSSEKAWYDAGTRVTFGTLGEGTKILDKDDLRELIRLLYPQP